MSEKYDRVMRLLPYSANRSAEQQGLGSNDLGHEENSMSPVIGEKKRMHCLVFLELCVV